MVEGSIDKDSDRVVAAAAAGPITREQLDLDAKLRALAENRALLDADEARALRDAERLAIHEAFGFGSLLSYLESVFGYTPRVAVERLRVARALGSLPLLASALENNELRYTAVRELSRVATPTTEATWLDEARGKSVEVVATIVAGHRKGDKPTHTPDTAIVERPFTLDLVPEAVARLRETRADVEIEWGYRLTDSELVIALCEAWMSSLPCDATGSAAMDVSFAGDDGSIAADTSLDGDRGSAGVGRSVDDVDTLSSGGSKPAGFSRTIAHSSIEMESANSYRAGFVRTGDDGSIAVNGISHGGSNPAGAAPAEAASDTHIGDALAAIAAFSANRRHSVDNGRARYQIAISVCPSCKRGRQHGAGNPAAIATTTLARAECDAQRIGSLDDGRPTRVMQDVPPATRRFVWLRDHGRCQVPGCRASRYVEVHHVVPRADGGSHDASNLVLACRGCHARIHAGTLMLAGRAPGVTFTRVQGMHQ